MQNIHLTNINKNGFTIIKNAFPNKSLSISEKLEICSLILFSKSLFVEFRFSLLLIVLCSFELAPMPSSIFLKFNYLLY